MNIVSLLVLLAVAAAWVAHARWAASAQRRIAMNKCTRCGLREPETVDGMPRAAATMCGRCRQRTQRTYRLGSWFFYLVALFLAIVAPGTVLTDYRTFGASAARQDLVVFALIITVTVGAGVAIRFFGRRVV